MKMGSSRDKLMKVHEEILKAEENAVRKRNRCALQKEIELKSGKVMKEECLKDTELLRPVYKKRSKIIETIPNFWLTAFSSHYTLGILLSEEDQKIFKFLESVDVKDTDDGTPAYTIALKFGENPYFKNTTLTKKIAYSSRQMDIRGWNINWKVSPTGNQQESLVKKGKKRGCTGGEISFFTWFSDHEDDSRGIPDEVAELIIEDLWPNAIKYFLNGNLTNEEEYAIAEDCRSYLCNEDR